MADIEPVIAMKPDALIMADPGLIMMVRESGRSRRFTVRSGQYGQLRGREILAKMGVPRIILSRELSIDEIAESRQECPDMELEVLCTAHCALPIQGVACYPVTSTTATRIKAPAPPCRWDYKMHDTADTDAGVCENQF